MKLKLEEILQATSVADVKELLRAIASEGETSRTTAKSSIEQLSASWLNKIYAETYRKAAPRNTRSRKIASRVYKTLMAAKRGMSIDCLTAAVCYTIENEADSQALTEDSAFKEETEVDSNFVRTVCSNLLVENRQTGLVTFTHFTVRQYLLEEHGPEYSTEEAHAQMAKSCLWILTRHLAGEGPPLVANTKRLIQLFNSQSISDWHAKTEDDLFCYALVFWCDHAQQSGQDPPGIASSDDWRALLQHFLANSQPGEAESSPFMRWLKLIRGFQDKSKLPTRLADSIQAPASPLVLACIWGIDQELTLCGPVRGDRDSLLATSSVEESFPCLCAKYGHKRVLERLIDDYAGCANQINIRDGRTAILTAAASGQDDIVHYLLAREDVSLYVKGSDGLSLLVWVAWRCSGSTLNKLLAKWQREEREICEAFVRACGRPSHRDGKSDTESIRIIINRLYDRLDGLVEVLSPGLSDTGNIDNVIDMTSSDGELALIRAIEARNKVALDFLLGVADKPSLEKSDGLSRVPLQVCAQTGYLEGLRALLHKGADINREGGPYGSAIHAAIDNDSRQVLEYLLGHKQVNVNIRPRDSSGRRLETPLLYCTMTGSVDMAIFLLKLDSWKRIDVNAAIEVDLPLSEGLSPKTALQAAMYWGESMLPLVRELLDRGAKVEVQEVQLSLLLAKVEIVKEFLSRSSCAVMHQSLNRAILPRGTALQTALYSYAYWRTPPHRSDVMSIIRLLLDDRRLDIDVTDEEPEGYHRRRVTRAEERPRMPPPIELAAISGDQEIFSMIMEQNPKLESTGSRWGSALAAVAGGISSAPRQSWNGGHNLNGHIRIARLLLDKGVNINAVGRAKETPLDCAINAQEASEVDAGEMIELLQARGGVRYLRTPRPATSLHFPPERGRGLISWCCGCACIDNEGPPRPARRPARVPTTSTTPKGLVSKVPTAASMRSLHSSRRSASIASSASDGPQARRKPACQMVDFHQQSPTAPIPPPPPLPPAPPQQLPSSPRRLLEQATHQDTRLPPLTERPPSQSNKPQFSAETLPALDQRLSELEDRPNHHGRGTMTMGAGDVEITE